MRMSLVLNFILPTALEMHPLKKKRISLALQEAAARCATGGVFFLNVTHVR